MELVLLLICAAVASASMTVDRVQRIIAPAAGGRSTGMERRGLQGSSNCALRLLPDTAFSGSMLNGSVASPMLFEHDLVQDAQTYDCTFELSCDETYSPTVTLQDLSDDWQPYTSAFDQLSLTFSEDGGGSEATWTLNSTVASQEHAS